MKDTKQELQQILKAAKESNETTFAGLKKRALESMNTLFTSIRVQSRLDEIVKECEVMMSKMDSKMKEIDVNQLITILLAKIPPQKIDTAEEERDRLESLKGDDRLDKSAIKGFDELEKSLRITASNRVQTPAKAFKIHNKDCTSQCDGSNKTFNVGGTHFGIVGVFGTQAPLIYRPIIDYTETANGFLLTSAVGAPETGQTLVAQFLK